MRIVPAEVRWVPPALARGASHRRSTTVIAPAAMPSAVGRLISTPVIVCRNHVLQPILSRISRVNDRYGSDILARNPHAPKRVRSTEHAVEPDMVVEDAQSGFVGAVVRIESGRVDLEDRHGKVRSFPLGPGFLLDGKPVILTPPKRVPA